MRKIAFFNKYITEISKSELYEVITKWAKNRESKSVFFANVHMLVETRIDKSFGSIFDKADIVLADGMPLVFSLNYLYKIEQERIAGMDFMFQVCELAEKESIKIFLYGSTNDVLEKIVDKCNNQYRNLEIVGHYSPPFREISDEEKEKTIIRINESGAGILMVALGCPKQEKWISQMKGKVNAVMLGLGGAFSIFADTQKRAPLWVQNNGLEWLFRLMQEPKRLWKRYLFTNTIFSYLFSIEVIKKMFSLTKKVSPKCLD